MATNVKAVDCNIRSTEKEFVITVTNFEATGMAILAAYDALEQSIHRNVGLPKMSLPETVGYLRAQYGITQTIAVEKKPPGSCL